MTFARWKQGISETFLITTNDGRTVFYPYGPFKGYLLPKTAFEPLVINSILWFKIATLAILAVTTIVGALANISMDMLLLVGLLDYVLYYFRIRRLSRKLISFPRRLSIRVCAAAQDSEQLWKRFWSSTFMAVVCAVCALLGPPRALFWGGSILFFAWAIVLAYIIAQHNRINAPPSTRDADKKYYVGQDAKHAADVIRNVGNTTSKNI